MLISGNIIAKCTVLLVSQLSASSRGMNSSDETIPQQLLNNYRSFKSQYAGKIKTTICNFKKFAGINNIGQTANEMLKVCDKDAKTTLIKPETFCEMLLLADKYALEEIAFQYFVENMLRYLMSSESEAKGIVKEKMKAQTRTVKMMICEILFSEHVPFTISNGILEWGVNSDMMLSSSRPLYNGNPMHMPAKAAYYTNEYVSALTNFSSIRMRSSLIGIADKHKRYLLLSLVGMLPLGAHVVSINYAKWFDGNFSEVLKIVGPSNVGGITGLRYYNYKALQDCARDPEMDKHLRASIRYLEFNVSPLDDNEDDAKVEKTNAKLSHIEKMLGFLSRFTLSSVSIGFYYQKGLLKDVLKIVGESTVIEAIDFVSDFSADHKKCTQLLHGRSISSLTFPLAKKQDFDALFAKFQGASSLAIKGVKSVYFDHIREINNDLEKFPTTADYVDLGNRVLKFVSSSGITTIGFDFAWGDICWKENLVSFLEAIFKSAQLKRLVITARKVEFLDIVAMVRSEMARHKSKSLSEIVIVEIFRSDNGVKQIATVRAD